MGRFYPVLSFFDNYCHNNFSTSLVSLQAIFLVKTKIIFKKKKFDWKPNKIHVNINNNGYVTTLFNYNLFMTVIR